jgi:hypothetical protein
MGHRKLSKGQDAMVRHIAVLGGLVVTLGFCGAARAARSDYPYPCPTPCTPNTATFGYFPTTWRLWPGDEKRIERINPRAVGAEVLPAPTGQKEAPPPKAATPQKKLPAAIPEGEILPPGGTILPPQPSGLPQPPPAEPKPEQPSKPAAEPKPEQPSKPAAEPKSAQPSKPAAQPKSQQPSKPAAEGGLPGLPVEPGPAALPALPEGGQPKENKVKEQPKPKGTTMRPSRENSQPAAQQANAGQAALWDKWAERPGAVVLRVDGDKPRRDHAAAAPLDERPVQNGTVVALLNHQESGPAPAASAAHRADSIDTAVPASPTRDITPAAYATAESLASPDAGNAKVGLPAVALNGYCPVDLICNGRWTPGELRYTVVHHGWIYRLSGSAQWRQFLANPDAFVPAYSGNDPVLATDEHRTVLGQVTYCATYDGRLYMFSDPATRARFNQNPQRYTVGK